MFGAEDIANESEKKNLVQYFTPTRSTSKHYHEQK